MYKVDRELEAINWYTGPRYVPARAMSLRSAANSRRLVREHVTGRAANDFCHFVTLKDNFFLTRVCQSWNELSDTDVTAPSLNSFKARLDSNLK